MAFFFPNFETKDANAKFGALMSPFAPTPNDNVYDSRCGLCKPLHPRFTTQFRIFGFRREKVTVRKNT